MAPEALAGVLEQCRGGALAQRFDEDDEICELTFENTEILRPNSAPALSRTAHGDHLSGLHEPSLARERERERELGLVQPVGVCRLGSPRLPGGVIAFFWFAVDSWAVAPSDAV